MSLLNLIMPTHAKLTAVISTGANGENGGMGESHSPDLGRPSVSSVLSCEQSPLDYKMADWHRFLGDHLKEKNWGHARAIASEIMIRCRALELETLADQEGVVRR